MIRDRKSQVFAGDILDYPTSYGSQSKALTLFKRSVDGMDFRWLKSGGYVQATLSASLIRIPFDERSFGGGMHAVNMFPHVDEITKGDFSPLYALSPEQECVMEKGAVGKIEVMPCVFEDQNCMLLLYPQVSAGYWKLANRLRKRFREWQLHTIGRIDFAAKAVGFKASVAMGPAQAREDTAYRYGFISESIVEENYISPYKKAGYAAQEASLMIQSPEPTRRRVVEGEWWVNRY